MKNNYFKINFFLFHFIKNYFKFYKNKFHFIGLWLSKKN
jgi:hypothetical protein